MRVQQNNITFWCLADGTVGFASLRVVSWSQKHCASVIQAGSGVHKTHNSAFLRSLGNSTSRQRSNVLILRNVAWYRLAVAAGACYVLNRIDNETANVKFPPGQNTKLRSADKSLVLPGRKRANIYVRMAWISFGALPCRGKTLMAARVSMLVEIRRVLTRFRACFLPGRAKDLSAPVVFVCECVCIYIYIYIGKVIRLQLWTGPEVSRSLRLPDLKKIGTWRG